jgi:hypothetical protein
MLENRKHSLPSNEVLDRSQGVLVLPSSPSQVCGQVTGPRSRLTRCAHPLSSLAMGIKGLTALIAEHAPKAISVCRISPRRLSLRPTLNGTGGQEHDIKTLFGRKVAIDASMSIYQFLIAVRSKDGELLTNDAGDTTR